MAMSLEAAAAPMRDAMRETVKRYSLWYLLQGILMAAAGVLALIYPMLASVAMMALLGWILILSGVVQGIGLIGARLGTTFLATARLGRTVDRRWLAAAEPA
jgi:uncharacterized membrane protein HdeD (DUF308 family)